MGVCHKRKLCFVHIPKTGGVSIQKALDMILVQHQPASYWKERYPDYKLFCVIRPPCDRLISAFRYFDRDKPDDFARAAKGLDFWIDVPCDFYLNFEDLGCQLNNMLKVLGHEPVNLQHLNTFDNPIRPRNDS